MNDSNAAPGQRELITAVGARLHAVRAQLADLGAADVEILAVTKGFDSDVVDAAAALGLKAVGENYAQELVGKAERMPAATVEWHFIGQLQSNKVADLAPHVGVWQSIDRLKLGTRLARYQPGARVFVQLRPAEATTEGPKGGCPAGDVPQLVDDLRDLGLDVDGIMTVGVQGDRDATQRAFAQAAELSERCELPVRSYGMSGDLADAVGLGSNMVRLGTALFGTRPPRS